MIRLTPATTLKEIGFNLEDSNNSAQTYKIALAGFRNPQFPPGATREEIEIIRRASDELAKSLWSGINLCAFSLYLEFADVLYPPNYYMAELTEVEKNYYPDEKVSLMSFRPGIWCRQCAENEIDRLKSIAPNRNFLIIEGRSIPYWMIMEDFRTRRQPLFFRPMLPAMPAWPAPIESPKNFNYTRSTSLIAMYIKGTEGSKKILSLGVFDAGEDQSLRYINHSPEDERREKLKAATEKLPFWQDKYELDFNLSTGQELKACVASECTGCLEPISQFQQATTTDNTNYVPISSMDQARDFLSRETTVLGRLRRLMESCYALNFGKERMEDPFYDELYGQKGYLIELIKKTCIWEGKSDE